MKNVFALLLALSWSVAAYAQSAPAKPAPPAACLSRVEAESLLLAAMPELLQGVSARCRASVSSDSLLGKGGETLVAPYRDAARNAWPGAKLALGKVLRAQGIPVEGLSDEGARGLLQIGASMLAGERLNGTSCGALNETLELLRPLPPQSVARLLSLIALAGQESTVDGRKSALRICKPA
jgi:hypothetical protein